MLNSSKKLSCQKTDVVYDRSLSQYTCIAFKAGTFFFQRFLRHGMSDNSFHIQKICENLFTMQSICYLLKALKRINGILKAFYRRYFVQIVRILQKKKVTEFRSANSWKCYKTERLSCPHQLQGETVMATAPARSLFFFLLCCRIFEVHLWAKFYPSLKKDVHWSQPKWPTTPCTLPLLFQNVFKLLRSLKIKRFPGWVK